jgi:hypothetical protein
MDATTPTRSRLSAGRDATEPAPDELSSMTGVKRGREALLPPEKPSQHEWDQSWPHDPCSPLPAARQGGPQTADSYIRTRDRDLGARRAEIIDEATPASPTDARARHADSPVGRQVEAAHRARPLHQHAGPGYDGMENTPGNRFGGDEICPSCWEFHADANYVATDASGVTYCGDCWDAALQVNIITNCVAFPPGEHQCACGSDLRTEQWIAVDAAPAAAAHCQCPDSGAPGVSD